MCFPVLLAVKSFTVSQDFPPLLECLYSKNLWIGEVPSEMWEFSLPRSCFYGTLMIMWRMMGSGGNVYIGEWGISFRFGLGFFHPKFQQETLWNICEYCWKDWCVYVCVHFVSCSVFPNAIMNQNKLLEMVCVVACWFMPTHSARSMTKSCHHLMAI